MNIVVLAGGTSTERDVSLVSGDKIYNALKSAGHKVLLLDVFLGLKVDSIEDVFERGEELSVNVEHIGEESPDLGAVKALREDGGKVFFGPNVLDICKKADVVFMALHGANGEDGRIQAAFDLLGIKYTGTDYLSSAICMDKAVTKKFFIEGGVPTPKAVTIYNHPATLKKDVKNAVEKIGFPLVVKACNGGSSVGVYIVSSQDEVNDAIRNAFTYDNKILIEEFIKGRELTCGVIKGKALPVVEIAPVAGFYDYKNKYQAGSTVETCPAEIGEELTKKVQAVSELAYETLGLETYARIDVMLKKNGDVYCLEANTLPGMTPTSLLPQEAGVLGMSYEDLCEYIIEISLEKYN